MLEREEQDDERFRENIKKIAERKFGLGIQELAEMQMRAEMLRVQKNVEIKKMVDLQRRKEEIGRMARQLSEDLELRLPD